ncbi:hypothetical protein NTH52_005024 [Vibrio harveyi]|nr:hypothetical protein [Vibrio harveyi]
MKELKIKGTQGSGGPFRVNLSRSEAQQILDANDGDQIELSCGERTLSIYEKWISINRKRSPESRYHAIDERLGAVGSKTYELDKSHFIGEIIAKFGLSKS